MKKIFLMFLIILVLSLCIMVQSSLPKEKVKPLSDIIVYCNTKKFVDNMVNNSYHMNVAAKGSVNDVHHKHLIEIQLWMNPTNNQWAIVFVYKEIDKSCVIGGNHIKLYSPTKE